MDEALNDVQSERELTKLGLDIADHIRGMHAQMKQIRRKRAVAVSGAVLGSIGAILVAVYGPAFQAAIASVGASGGVWGLIHAAAENSPMNLREDKWYYA